MKVSIITPDSLIQETLQALNRKTEAKVGRKLFNHRRILEATTPNTVTVLVVDRNASSSLSRRTTRNQILTRNSMVLADVRFFERMWEEVELREKEEALLEREKRSRKAAELLQDIMAHDIRNYNQFSKTGAELLKEDFQSTQRLSLIDSILRATDGSSELIDRAKKLGRIISQAYCLRSYFSNCSNINQVT